VANFLDTTTTLSDGYLTTTLYTKTTDKHMYLFFNSCHPPHNKTGIPYSQALRIRRICSNDSEFTKHTELLKGYLLARGYILQLINDSIKWAKSLDRISLITPRPTITNTPMDSIIPLVTTYHPNSQANKILQSFKQTLILDPLLKEIFEHQCFLTAYKHPPNLRDILVRAKFSSKLFFQCSTRCETKKCGKRCKNTYHNIMFTRILY
jgi:hypothetical protein